MVAHLLLASLVPAISLAATIHARDGSSLHARQNSTEPCAVVSREWAAQKAANVSGKCGFQAYMSIINGRGELTSFDAQEFQS